MGNQLSFNIFEKHDNTKKKLDGNKYSEDDNNKREKDFTSQHNLLTNKKNIIENNKIVENHQVNSEMNNKEYNRGDESDIEKIKKENFYLFDESLNSNNVKHPCHSQWFLFWVYAAYLNENFLESEKEHVTSFYSNFPEQCIRGKGKNCFAEFSQIHPIRANTRTELMMWLQMCENYCRQKAGLPVKMFNYSKLLKRWRYDDGYI
ncbi:conserved Plasmodium protein, unknown function [Plasmodium chabaudi adami]|uniref:thiol oxidase n=1 Tax=Plasmodium chabaudi adami TaxID=5826 RepID=A0A1D3RZV3_PLACE|nr:conserved Plasmodium protein, unknown function [Plasmodium chabaudi adami]